MVKKVNFFCHKQNFHSYNEPEVLFFYIFKIMKKTSIAMCAVLFGALFISNAFAAEETATTTGDVVTTTAAEVTTGEAVATEAAAETTTGDVVAEATTGDVATGAVATEATTGDVATGAVAAEATTGAVATGDVAAEATTGEAEVSINDALHAILDKYFEDNASKFNTAKDKKDFFETVKANINKAADKAREAQKEAFEIIKGALETYEIK